ncbi:hypothetical protein [Hoyosella subflava]|uniref:hypothetical protein n=1 Tax=Hoyosella subflava TaxID=639313 RepID=UPI0011D2BA83|nr:hypothetical protein [Hoyosella subflava]
MSILTICLLIASAPPATAREEPDLTLPSDALSQAVSCHAGQEVQLSRRPEPLLLVPGAGAAVSQGLLDELLAAGHTACVLTPPDIHARKPHLYSEYVVNAVRAMEAVHGDRISVVGSDDGATIALGTLHQWPSTAPAVKAVVSIAPRFSTPLLASGDAAARWYSTFENRSLPSGPSYTAVVHSNDARTLAGHVSLPENSPPLAAMTVVAVQDACPWLPPEARIIGTTAQDRLDDLLRTQNVSLADDPIAQKLTAAVLAASAATDVLSDAATSAAIAGARQACQ